MKLLNHKAISSLLLLCLGLTGCVSVSRTLREIPGAEFEEFKYSSKTNATSTSIHAVGGKVDDDKMLIIDIVEINHNNPFIGISTSVKGLKVPARQIATSASTPIGN